MNCDSNSLKHDSMFFFFFFSFFFGGSFFFTLGFVFLYILYIVLHFLSKLLVSHRDSFCLTLSCTCIRAFCFASYYPSLVSGLFVSLHLVLHLCQSFFFHIILHITSLHCPSLVSGVLFHYPFFIIIVHYNISQ